MAVTITRGIKFVVGIQKPLPLRGWPEGKIRLRARRTDRLRAYVKTAGGIREFSVKEVEGFWEPAVEIGWNRRWI
jgi:hypothetical protein